MADEPKWTPGPLEVCEAFLRSGDDEWTLHPTDPNWDGPCAGKGHIAYVWGKANADLFAHAAELYEKLENLLASITAYCAGKPPELLPLSVFGKPIVEAIGALRRANPSQGESPDAK